MFCPYCGKIISESTEVCPHCHNVVPPLQPFEEPSEAPTELLHEPAATTAAALEATQPDWKLDEPMPIQAVEPASVPVEPESWLESESQAMPEPEAAAEMQTQPEIFTDEPWAAAEPTEEVWQPAEPVPTEPVPAPMPSAAAPTPAARKPAKRAKKPKKKGTVVVILLIAALLIACLSAAAYLFTARPAWLPFDLPELKLPWQKETTASSRFLVGYPDRSLAYDVEWMQADKVKEEKEIIFAEARYDFTSGFAYFVKADGQMQPLTGPASIIPGTERVLIQTTEDDENLLYVLDPGMEEPAEVFKSSAIFNTYMLADGTILIIESRDTGERAYVSQDLAEAKRMLKGDHITYLSALNQFLVTEEDDESVKFWLADPAGEEVAEVYEGAPALEQRIAPDGSLLVLVTEEEDNLAVRLFDLRAQKEVANNDDFAALKKIGFTGDSSLAYFIGEDEEGLLSLYTSSGGEWSTLLEQQAMLSVAAHTAMPRLAVVVVPPGENAKYSIKMVVPQDEKAYHLYSSEYPLTLMNTTKDIPDFFFVLEQAEDSTTQVLSFKFGTGKKLVVLEEELAEAPALMTAGNKLLVTYNIDGQTNYWLTSADAEDGFDFAEDWDALRILDTRTEDGAALLVGREEADDDWTLYLTRLEEDADWVKVDAKAAGYPNAYFVPGSDRFIYTVQTGTDVDELEVRSQAFDADLAITEDALLLAEEASILSTAWQEKSIFSWGMLLPVSMDEGSGVQALRGEEVLELTLPKGQQSMDYSMQLKPGVVYFFSVEAAPETVFDPALYFNDAQGNYIAETTYNTTTAESYLIARKEPTELVLTITNNLTHTTDIDFTLRVQSFVPTPLPLEKEHEDELTSEDRLEVPGEQTFYWDVYSFEAEANGYYYIQAQTSPDLQYSVNVLDGDLVYIGGAYSGYNGQYLFEISTPQAGTYILYIGEFSASATEYDSSKDHSYTLLVSEQPIAEAAPVEEVEVVAEEPMPAAQRVGLVTDVQGIESKYMVAPVWQTMLKAAEYYGYEVDYLESVSADDYYYLISTFASDGYDVIITCGYGMLEATEQAAADYPQVRFIGVDMKPTGWYDNLTYITFEYWQRGFLAGALAAELTQTNTIAGIYAVTELDAIVKIAEGFEDGAHYINPDVTVFTHHYEGDIGASFMDEPWGQEMADTVIAAGADVVFTAAGVTGQSALKEAATYDGVYCIGIDYDQWDDLPEAHNCLAASAMVGIEETLLEALSRASWGGLSGGEYPGGVAISSYHDFEVEIDDWVKDSVNWVAQDLNSGYISYDQYH